MLTSLVTLGESCRYLGLFPWVCIGAQVGDQEAPPIVPSRLLRLEPYGSDAFRKGGGAQDPGPGKQGWAWSPTPPDSTVPLSCGLQGPRLRLYSRP